MNMKICRIFTGEYWKWKGQSCIHDIFTPLLNGHPNNQSLGSSYDVGAWTKTHFLMAPSILHRTLNYIRCYRSGSTAHCELVWKTKESLGIPLCLLTVQSQETLQESSGGGTWEICRGCISTQSTRSLRVRAPQIFFLRRMTVYPCNVTWLVCQHSW